MTVRHWFPSEQAAVDAVAEMERLGFYATVGYPVAVEFPTGGDVVEWPVVIDVSFAELEAQRIARTELDEHDVGMSTGWDDA